MYRALLRARLTINKQIKKAHHLHALPVAKKQKKTKRKQKTKNQKKKQKIENQKKVHTSYPSQSHHFFCI